MTANLDLDVVDGTVTASSNWAFVLRRAPDDGPSKQPMVWVRGRSEAPAHTPTFS